MYFDLSTLAETVAVDEGMIDNIKNKVSDLRDKYRKTYHKGVATCAGDYHATTPQNLLNAARAGLGKKRVSSILKANRTFGSNPIGKKLNSMVRAQSPVHNI